MNEENLPVQEFYRNIVLSLLGDSCVDKGLPLRR